MEHWTKSALCGSSGCVETAGIQDGCILDTSRPRGRSSSPARRGTGIGEWDAFLPVHLESLPYSNAKR
jgi:hypothetical protein